MKLYALSEFAFDGDISEVCTVDLNGQERKILLAVFSTCEAYWLWDAMPDDDQQAIIATIIDKLIEVECIP